MQRSMQLRAVVLRVAAIFAVLSWQALAAPAIEVAIRGTLCPPSLSFQDVGLAHRPNVLAELVVSSNGTVQRLPVVAHNASGVPAELDQHMGTSVHARLLRTCGPGTAGAAFYSLPCEFILPARQAGDLPIIMQTHVPGLACHSENGAAVSSALKLSSHAHRARLMRQAAEPQWSTGELRALVVFALWPGAEEQPNFEGLSIEQLVPVAEAAWIVAKDQLNAQAMGVQVYSYSVAEQFYTVTGDNTEDLRLDLEQQLANEGLYNVPEAPYNSVAMVLPWHPFSWGGLGQVGGRFTWYNGYRSLDPGLVIHEVGHNQRMWHDYVPRAGYSSTRPDGRRTIMGSGDAFDHASAGNKVYMRWIPLDATVPLHPAGSVASDCQRCVPGGTFTMEPADRGVLPPGITHGGTPSLDPLQRARTMAMRTYYDFTRVDMDSRLDIPHEVWLGLKSNASLDFSPEDGCGLNVYRFPFGLSVGQDPALLDMTPTTATRFYSISDADIAQSSAGVVRGTLQRELARGLRRDAQFNAAPLLVETFMASAASAAVAASSGVLPEPALPNATVVRARYMTPFGTTLDGIGCDGQGCAALPEPADIRLGSGGSHTIQATLPMQQPHAVPRPWLRLSADAVRSTLVVLCDEDGTSSPEDLVYWLAVYDSTPEPHEQVFYGAEANTGPLAAPAEFGDGYFTHRVQVTNPNVCGGLPILAALALQLPATTPAEGLHVVAGAQPLAARANTGAAPSPAAAVPLPLWRTDAPTRKVSIVVTTDSVVPSMDRVLANFPDSSRASNALGMVGADAHGQWVLHRGLQVNGHAIYRFEMEEVNWGNRLSANRVYAFWEPGQNRWRVSIGAISELIASSAIAGPVGVTNFYDIENWVDPDNEQPYTTVWRPLCQMGFTTSDVVQGACTPCTDSLGALFPRFQEEEQCVTGCFAGFTTAARIYGEQSSSLAVVCTSCSRGSYKTAAGNHGCTACPVNTMTASDGATSVADCSVLPDDAGATDPWSNTWAALDRSFGGSAEPDSYLIETSLLQELQLPQNAAEGARMCKFISVSSSTHAVDSGVYELRQTESNAGTFIYYHVDNGRVFMRSDNTLWLTNQGEGYEWGMNFYRCEQEVSSPFPHLCGFTDMQVDCLCEADEQANYVDVRGVPAQRCVCPSGSVLDEATGRCTYCTGGDCSAACPANSYGTGGACASCPEPMVSIEGATSVDQCTCPIGFVSSGSSCTPVDECPGLGEVYCPLDGCVNLAAGFSCSCPAGTIPQPPAIARDEPSCTPCNAGFYAQDGVCAQCLSPSLRLVDLRL